MRNVSRQEIEPVIKALLDMLGERQFWTGSLTLNFHEGQYKSCEISKVHRPPAEKPVDSGRGSGAG